MMQTESQHRKAYLSLGSNLGNREGNLRDAIARIRTLGRVAAVSSFYETEPVDFLNQPWFLNCVIVLETQLPPRSLLQRVLAIERSMGRERHQPKGPRLIDIDILLLDNQVIDEPELTIPHPALQTRRFVLEPLAEIAPQAMHPVLRKNAQKLLEELSPVQQTVRKIPQDTSATDSND
ncbi:MAG TPA: 2-amino-4-hydroxy-6-hydroxymethyldihydropteridine diphosphokinase [Terriglobales bacterium]|nr:2-amino-4-hydroxy-6-hydroxymethyldihydropteridine diphosphokinase [Terriglobales bacterium]